MKDLFSIEGKVALITGGSRGIGEMIARGYVAAGAKTYIVSRNAEACEALATELGKSGTCVPLAADLGTPEGIEALSRTLAERETKLDILVNNAGANWAAPVDEYPQSGWDKVLNLNLKSVFFLTQSLLPLLRAAGTHDDPARVINTGSIDGLHAPGLETFAYSASKAGVHHLTRVLAKRLAPDHITVNAIAPGPFESKMMAQTLKSFGDAIAEACPLKRIGKPEDMAGIAIYFGSKAGAYVTGTVIPVDGGISTTL